MEVAENIQIRLQSNITAVLERSIRPSAVISLVSLHCRYLTNITPTTLHRKPAKNICEVILVMEGPRQCVKQGRLNC